MAQIGEVALMQWVGSMRVKYGADKTNEILSLLEEYAAVNKSQAVAYGNKDFSGISSDRMVAAGENHAKYSLLNEKMTAIVNAEDLKKYNEIEILSADPEYNGPASDYEKAASARLSNEKLHKYTEMAQMAIAAQPDGAAKEAKKKEIEDSLKAIMVAEENKRNDRGFFSAFRGHDSAIVEAEKKFVFATSGHSNFDPNSYEHYEYDARIAGSHGAFASQILAGVIGKTPEAAAQQTAKTEEAAKTEENKPAATTPAATKPEAKPAATTESKEQEVAKTEAPAQQSEAEMQAAISKVVNGLNNRARDDLKEVDEAITKLEAYPELQMEVANLRAAVAQKKQAGFEVDANGRESIVVSTGASQALVTLNDAVNKDGTFDLNDAKRMVTATTEAVAENTVKNDTDKVSGQLLTAVNDAKSKGVDIVSALDTKAAEMYAAADAKPLDPVAMANTNAGQQVTRAGK